MFTFLWVEIRDFNTPLRATPVVCQNNLASIIFLAKQEKKGLQYIGKTTWHQ
jgi:hypothetical protein